MNLPQLPQDKANHLIYGLVIFILVHFFFGVSAGLLAGTVAAVAKEVYDKVSGKGNPELLDALATIAGAVLGALATAHI
jgi:hypothetical protein